MAGAPRARGALPAQFPPDAPLRRHQAHAGQRWIFLEDIGSFPWEGTRIFTAPDFGYWSWNDRLQLVDWKTGGAGAGASLQLGGYALYALEVLGVDLARVDLLEVNLREGSVTAHPWDRESGPRADFVRLSVRSMKAYLEDPVSNVAREADFEKTGARPHLPLVQLPRGVPPELPPFLAPAAEPAGA